MKTEQQLLEEYTQLTKQDWKNLDRQRAIKTELDQIAKDDTKRLRVVIRRLIHNTTWTLEHAAYWALIGHGSNPVTCTMQGRVELYHFRENLRSLTKLEVNFAPADEERTLLYLEAVINATKP